MKYTSTLLFVFISFICFAQEDAPTIKWGKLEEGDAAMKVYEKDNNASAVVLADVGNIIVELEQGEAYYRYKRHRRIKVLKPEGVKKAILDINYITTKPYQEQVTYFQANHFIGDEGKKKNISKNAIVKNKQPFFETKSFKLPENIQTGDIIEYRYEIVSPRIEALREWYFQEDIPVKLNMVSIEIPSVFKYFYLIQGNLGINYIPQSERAISFKGRVTKVKNDIYFIKDVPAYKAEPFVNTPDDYRARLKFQLEEVKFLDKTFDVITTFDEIRDKLIEFPLFGKQYTDEGQFKKFLNAETQPILEANISETEKAAKLYGYLAKTLKWDGVNAFLSYKPLNEVFGDKSGNSTSLNLALLALLKKAGIKAEPVLISTRDHGRVRENYPVVDQFNHTIIYAVLDGKETLLDMGEPYKAMVYPNKKSLNKVGCLLTDPIKWIPINAPETSSLTLAKFAINANGSLSGYTQGKYKGYHAVDIRKDLASGEVDFPKNWSAISDKVQIDKVEVKKMDQLDHSLHVIGNDISIQNVVRNDRDTLRFKPVLVSEYFENPFKEMDRKTPVQLNYPLKETFIAHYTIPEGYEVASLPTPIGLALADNQVNFHLNIEAVGKQIQLIHKISITNTIFDVVDYEALSILFQQVAQKLEQEIILVPTK